jgi:small subunit ribosomal protein S5e
VSVQDISLADHIAVKQKSAQVYLPHTAGRWQAKRFRKNQCPIVERLINALMQHGRNNGKKMLAVRIVKHAMELIHLTTGENPLQIVVQAVANSGPREDSTRIGSAGVVRRQAVDVAPLRRINIAIGLLSTGVRLFNLCVCCSPHIVELLALILIFCFNLCNQTIDQSL